MPMAPMPPRLSSPTPMPSGPRSWSPCLSSVDTLLSPAPSHSHCSPTDPSLYKLHNYSNSNSRNIQAHRLQQPLTYNSNNNNNNNNLAYTNAQQEWSQIKLSPVSAHPHPQHQQQQQRQMPLTSQLDYYRQLQIMHCQRERDIGQLYRQHQIFQQQQQQQQPDRPPSHAIQRGLLAQRMLQLQRLFQAQQIQRMQAMHKMGRATVPAGASSAQVPPPSSSPSSSPSPSPSSFSFSSNGLLGTAAPESASVQVSSESEQSRAEAGLAQQQPEENKMTKIHGPNTIHLSSTTTTHPTPKHKKTSSVPELAQIVLPSPDQIRKQRQQRLKFQARLRQAASTAAKTLTVSSPKATSKGTTAYGVQGQSTMLMPVSPPASPSPYSTSTPDFSTSTPQQQHSPSFAITTTNTMTVTTAAPLSPVTPTMPTPKESTFSSSHSPSVPLQLPAANGGVPKIQPAVWTSSTTSLVARSKADLAYRRQLRLQLAIQQHLIQDHTHRYRLFQAFCLLQRAQAAQAMEEVQTHRERQLHTVAWVQALRQSQALSQLEIPQ
ncbi:hypothetical protein BGZ88_010846 [Linnemannia elongata]|nr:hypothetical protein BGZ88_010846 [Linnemannia elongata]